MKILLAGVLDKSWSTNCSMKLSLEALGHEVIPFNYRTIEQSTVHSNSLLYTLKQKIASFLRSAKTPYTTEWYYNFENRKAMNTLFLKTIKENKFDLILLSKTDTINYHNLSQITQSAPTWYFFMDPMSQARRINAAEYAKRATWSSATFSDVATYFKKKGANAYWITQGVDTAVFKKLDLPKVYDVIFVGTKDRLRSNAIAALRKTGIAVTCFGEGWENPPVYQQELVRIYNQSRVVLNLCRKGKGFSIRVFQIMGCGSFLLSQYCHDLSVTFQQDQHLDWFSTDTEMIEKVRHYLAADVQRETIAECGRKFVYEQYSWDILIKKMLDIITTKRNKANGIC